MTSDEGPIAYLAERVRIALATDQRTGVLGLVVAPAAGRICIRGAVPSHECHDAVARVAEEIAEHVAVLNETTVTPAPDPGVEHEVLQ